MENRRAHGDCAAAKGGCEVVIGASCGGARGVGKGNVVGRLWRRRKGRDEVSLVMWVIGLLVMSFIVNLSFVIRFFSSNR